MGRAAKSPKTKTRVKAGTSKSAAAVRKTKFIEAMIANGGNKREAAIVAGYKPGRAADKAGERLSHDVAVAAELDRRRAEVIALVEKNTEVTKEWVVARLKTVAERCMQVAPVVNKKGEPILTETPDGTLALAFEFNSAGANRALELLGKEQGMFVDRKESGPPGAFTEDRAAIEARVKERSVKLGLAKALPPTRSV